MNTTATNVHADFVNISAISPVSVCNGAFKYQNYVMEFEFEAPFKYQGGHLLVDIVKSGAGGVELGVNFAGGGTAYTSDPNSQEWRDNPNNFVGRFRAMTGNTGVSSTASPQFPEITFTYTPCVHHKIAASTSAGGSVSPSGTLAIEEGDDQTYIFTPNVGYRIDRILVDGENNETAVSEGKYTFTNVQVAHTIKAEFVRKTYDISRTVDGGSGAITSDDEIPVKHGDSARVVFTPSEGFRVAQVLVDGESNEMAVSNGFYTFKNVTAPHSISVLFVLKTYGITPSVNGGNGAISPDTTVTVYHGSDQRFELLPNVGFKVARVLIDSINHETAVANGYYTFERVADHHFIEAFFEPIVFTCTASVTNDGAIYPSGETQVIYGENQVYSVASKPGSRIVQLLVDGVEKPDAIGERFYVHIFENVTANHSIEVVFSLSTAVQANAGKEALVVYPNPVSGELRIETDKTISQIVVLDLNGKALLQQNGNSNTIDLHAIPSGSYIVRVHTETAVVPVKIVKQ
jgi:hypothetical protein